MRLVIIFAEMYTLYVLNVSVSRELHELMRKKSPQPFV